MHTRNRHQPAFLCCQRNLSTSLRPLISGGRSRAVLSAVFPEAVRSFVLRRPRVFVVPVSAALRGAKLFPLLRFVLLFLAGAAGLASVVLVGRRFLRLGGRRRRRWRGGLLRAARIGLLPSSGPGYFVVPVGLLLVSVRLVLPPRSGQSLLFKMFRR